LHDDFVLFEDSNVAYRDEHDPLDTTRVLKGELISNTNKLKEYRANFDTLIKIRCLDQPELDALLRQ
jgi:hypothetical protein